ncbi:universal stress protein [Halogeometricum borinquense]|uniref:Universal stress protein UspA-like protein n=2 Tax=Halogeometricum borinquense TaxID=60847 RepID=E4NSV0_HALBP|nr:universal stress protein [Halogeometricum borinquense]ADQ65838.1 universal stress protein UspA-like protein [Halogeometricum borinquense DSM 11551]ELY26840.1 universal stress protein uspa-like protein [Halogeometricum borinquense DSM 11551]QIB76303.1 universal stress protein [Halogeometricum borinquense]QIQ75261.1 universal stress protein [Halogeometricum borinquense]RYJ14892.1 universal stress protein [Halogeometricum borinquense]
MKILAPIDGSECSIRAAEFAVEFAVRFEADLHVVHFSDAETDATDIVLGRARDIIEGTDLSTEPELSIIELDVVPGKQVGEEILNLVDERDFDHVVMGHHGDGAIERAILGSAAETVVRHESVAATIIP